jgi:hypothetical protein
VVETHTCGNLLARRLGLTVHQSLLERRLRAAMRAFPSATAICVEDWLLDVAHARGARIVHRANPPGRDFVPPPAAVLSDEDLVVAICHTQRQDRPQLLRLAGQIVSRGAIATDRLLLAARRERVEPVLAEMARQALRVEPGHSVWQRVAAACRVARPLRSPVIHWQRLAWPVMKSGRCNAERWELVR